MSKLQKKEKKFVSSFKQKMMILNLKFTTNRIVLKASKIHILTKSKTGKLNITKKKKLGQS